MALVKSIVFVDGENLVFRYQALLKEGRSPHPWVVHHQDIFVWQPDLWRPVIDTDVIRINYYSCMTGDDDSLTRVRQEIASIRYLPSGDYYGPCELTPRLYKKDSQSRKSRLVDVNMTIDVMRHAYTDAVDVVYLLSGDGDFVELVGRVESEGRTSMRVLASISSTLRRVSSDFSG